jgi:tetratricopeptide (TPR) repeat protein
LRQLVRKVRRTLQDDGEHQAVIRTIPYFGFHWVAETRRDEVQYDGPGSKRDATPIGPIAARARPAGRAGFVARVASCLLLAILVLPLIVGDTARDGLAGGAHAEAGSGDIIGVLPVVLGGEADPGTTWMRLGLMDLVAEHLREAELRVVPSSDIVALDHERRTDEALVQRVRTATRAQALVRASVTQREDLWVVRLDLHARNGDQRSVEARAPDVLVAAHEASNYLLRRLGKSPTAPAAQPSAPGIALVLRQIEAAMMVDDFPTARALVETAPASLRELPELQFALARVDTVQRKDKETDARLRSLLDAVSAESDPVLRARVLTALAHAHQLEDGPALAWLAEAIELLEGRDEPAHLAAAYSERGWIHIVRRRYDEAAADYALARTTYALADDALGSAHVDNGEAVLDLLRGEAADALPLFERAAQQFERFGALNDLASVLINQIETLHELLRPREALAAYEEAIRKLADCEDAQMLRVVRMVGARALAANGRLRESRALLEDVLRTADPRTEVDVVAAASRIRGQLELSLGNPEAAIPLAQRTIDLQSATGRGYSESTLAALVLLRALRQANRHAEATDVATQVSQWARDLRQPDEALVHVRLIDAEQAWSNRDRARAVEYYEDALRIAESSGNPLDAAEVVWSYGNALIDMHDFVLAGTVVGRAGRWTDRDFHSALLQARLYQALGRPDAWRTALDQAQRLAGERAIPHDLTRSPQSVTLTDNRGPLAEMD